MEDILFLREKRKRLVFFIHDEEFSVTTLHDDLKTGITEHKKKQDSSGNSDSGSLFYYFDDYPGHLGDGDVTENISIAFICDSS